MRTAHTPYINFRGNLVSYLREYHRQVTVKREELEADIKGDDVAYTPEVSDWIVVMDGLLLEIEMDIKWIEGGN